MREPTALQAAQQMNQTTTHLQTVEVLAGEEKRKVIVVAVGEIMIIIIVGVVDIPTTMK